jgi:GNAT superfamily N-acetyltransferase
VRSADFAASGLEDRETFVAELDGRPVGWASFGRQDGGWWLDDLWVLPEFMGHGVGTALFELAVSRGRDEGFTALEWETDANAIGFYERMGARHVRDSAATRWSEPLPILRLELS